MNPSEFRNELESLINRTSMEQAGGNTPDFVLAEYLVACLAAFDHATKTRDQWYGIAEKVTKTLSGEGTPTPL